MKYIRTKDGLWAYNEKEKCAERPNKEMGCTQVWLNFKKEYIVKQADTIEKLVDEYVRVHKTFNNMSMVCDKELAISSSKYPKHYDVYGSIWVDGELHKVAKMNEKGELELL